MLVSTALEGTVEETAGAIKVILEEGAESVEQQLEAAESALSATVSTAAASIEAVVGAGLGFDGADAE